MEKLNWKRNAILYIVSQAITLFGSMLVYYALLWHLTLETQSGMMMMWITMAGTLPMVVVSPIAGVWADRYNKKAIINLADAAIALVSLLMGILWFFGIHSFPLIIIILVIRAFGQGIQSPATFALLPEIVPQDKLLKVNGYNASVQSLAMFASPMVGALILNVLSIEMIFFIDVFTAIIGIFILFKYVHVPFRKKKTDIQADFFKEFKEGMSYIKSFSLIKKFMIVSIFFNLLSGPASTMTTLHVVREWGENYWNLFNTLSIGVNHRLAINEMTFFIGLLLGGIIIGKWQIFDNKSKTVAFAILATGTGSLFLGVFTNFWLYALMMLLTGIVLAFYQPPRMAIIQSNVDPDFLGRVMSVFMIIANVIMPLGMVLWGPLGDSVPISIILIVTGLLHIPLGLWVLFDKTMLKAGRSIPSKTS